MSNKENATREIISKIIDEMRKDENSPLSKLEKKLEKEGFFDEPERPDNAKCVITITPNDISDDVTEMELLIEIHGMSLYEVVSGLKKAITAVEKRQD